MGVTERVEPHRPAGPAGWPIREPEAGERPPTSTVYSTEMMKG